MRKTFTSNDLAEFETQDLTPSKSGSYIYGTEPGSVEFAMPKGNGGTIADDRARDLSKIKGSITEMTQHLFEKMEAMTKEELVTEWTSILKEANSRSKRGSMSAKKLLFWLGENKGVTKRSVMDRITASYLAGSGLAVGE